MCFVQVYHSPGPFLSPHGRCVPCRRSLSRILWKVTPCSLLVDIMFRVQASCVKGPLLSLDRHYVPCWYTLCRSLRKATACSLSTDVMFRVGVPYPRPLALSIRALGAVYLDLIEAPLISLYGRYVPRRCTLSRSLWKVAPC